MRRFIAGWLTLLLCSWYLIPVHAALDFSGTGQYLSLGSALLTAAPLTVCGWFNTDTETADETIFSIGSSTSGDFLNLQVAGTAAGDPVRWIVRSSAATANAAGTTDVAINTWYHACGVEAASNSRQVYVNGIQEGTNATSKTYTGLNDTNVARRFFTSPDNLFNGRLADILVWDAALNAQELLALYNGAHPLKIRRANLVSWIPMWGSHSPEIDLVAARSWTITGAPGAFTGPRVGLFWRN